MMGYLAVVDKKRKFIHGRNFYLQLESTIVLLHNKNQSLP